jgi:hypothetical protein
MMRRELLEELASLIFTKKLGLGLEWAFGSLPCATKSELSILDIKDDVQALCNGSKSFCKPP